MAVSWTTPELKDMVVRVAEEHGLNVNHFLAVANREVKKDSNGNWLYTAKSDIDPNSWGIFQVNLNAHREITLPEAQNPLWSAEWAASQWDSGNASIWTSWLDFEKVYGTGTWPT